VRRKAAAPLGWVLADHLSGGDPGRLAAAWDCPYAAARCLFDARRDIRGEDDSLESRAEEERFDAYVAARDAEAKGAVAE
jgi:hypothetical protein